MSKNALKVFSFQSSRYSESCFSVSRGVISSIAVSIENKYFEQTYRLKVCRFSSLQEKPDGPKFPKGSLNFDLSRFSNSIFSEFSRSICCIKISIEFFWSYHKSIDWKVVGFLLHQKRDWNNVPKTDFHTELPETSNLMFCVATRFVSPIKVSVGNPTVLVQDSIEKFLIWFLYQIFDVQESTECCVLNQLGFQNHVSPLVEAWFLPSRSQSETIILNRRLGWKYVDFLPCNGNLMIRRFQKVQWYLIHLDILTQFSRNFLVRFVASRFQLNFFGVVTNQSIKSNQSVWFLPSTCQSKTL